MKRNDMKGMKVTVMGLGLNGGGIESTRFLVSAGAEVTVTDLRDEATLAPSLEKLSGLRFRTVLGRHEVEDFSGADMVIKNPAVRPGNPFVAAARRIETDLSLFFSLVGSPVIAVTGSKGKSTTASAIHHGLLGPWPQAKIGGNITISPLSFLDSLEVDTPVVMELSSFQLGDLERSASFQERQSLPGFPPHIAIVTSIFHDHQDYYKSMPAYIADKEIIFRHQRPDQHAIFCVDDGYGPAFAAKAPAKVWRVSAKPLPEGTCGAWLEDLPAAADHFLGPQGFLRDGRGSDAMILGRELGLNGRHHRLNLLLAGTALHIMGIPAVEIRDRLGNFGGVEHRLETIGRWNGITFINDSAATIPEAALGAVSSLDAPIHLITGGTDKALHFGLFETIHGKAKSVNLLAGTASDQIAALFREKGLVYGGPWNDLEACVRQVMVGAGPGEIILLSPGCASFGLFLNEFDRGKRFKATVRSLTGLP
jgi:UDP-N-acetylmuramoylalanine--D-glutamate ligase